MTAAIMQPYLFPYLGYYQLVHHADVFVIYDDVTYIKQGYVNRNWILANGKPLRFTLPVLAASSNKLIKDLAFSRQTAKLMKTFRQAYSKAPYFEQVYPIVQRAIENENRGVVEVCWRGISEVFSYLGVDVTAVRSSDLNYDRSASAEDKIVQICKSLGAKDYVNSVGGRRLYSARAFAEKNVNLSFVEPKDIRYVQGKGHFVPNLSMIDVLMWCDAAHVRKLLDAFRLTRDPAPNASQE